MTEEDYCSQCGYFPPHCECKDYISIRDMKAKKSHIVRHQTKQIKQLKQQLAEKKQENQQLKALLEYLKEQTEHCRDYELAYRYHNRMKTNGPNYQIIKNLVKLLSMPNDLIDPFFYIYLDSIDSISLNNLKCLKDIFSNLHFESIEKFHLDHLQDGEHGIGIVWEMSNFLISVELYIDELDMNFCYCKNEAGALPSFEECNSTQEVGAFFERIKKS